MRIRTLVVAGLLFSSSAYAADHFMHVDEVMLDGGNGEQYIEFHDEVAEGLPNGPYKVVIYNDAGTMVDTITLTGLTAGPDVYYTIGNLAAETTYSSITFDGSIVNELPAAGTACFERSNNAKVHCLTWGCAATTYPQAQAGMLPPSGMSLSRTSSGLLQHAIGTPKAANSAGTAAGCSVTAPDAGTNNPSTPDAGTAGGGDDDSGCCQSSPTGATSGAFLSLLVLGVLRRRRRV